MEWNLIGSKLTVHWDPVVTMEMESEVTGYKVRYKIIWKNICTTTKEKKTIKKKLKEQNVFVLDYSETE